MAEALSPRLREFVETAPIGVLATTRPDGGIRQSVVYHRLLGDRIHISTLTDRAKARDVRRTGRASYCVMGHERPFPCLTIEGPARIVTEGVGENLTWLLTVLGGAPDAPLSDEEAAAMGRVVLEIDVERVYGVGYLEG